MAIMRRRNLGDMVSMYDRINRFFEDSFRDYGDESESLTSWCPAADIYETDDDYVFKLEVPGIPKDDIKIDLQNNTLNIKGERKEDKEVKKENFHRVESYCGSFSRSFALPRNVDVNKINAVMKDGILELRIAKAEEQKAKAITIS